MILVFGKNGQLGRELADAAAERSCPLVAVTRHEADIADLSAVRMTMERHQPTVVVNAAAYTDVDRAETEVAEANRSNGDGPAILARACRAGKVPLIHISTDYVFDGRKQEPYRETDDVCPLGAYGRSKATGEAAVTAETGHYAIIRTAWLFGKYGHNFLKTMMALAQVRDEIRVVDDQRGCPTSARSLAGSIIDIAPRLAAERELSGIYHFAGHPVTTWRDFASFIVSTQSGVTGRLPKVEGITTAEYGAIAPRPMNSVLDCTKIKRVFGVDGRSWRTETTDVVRDILSAKPAQTDNVQIDASLRWD
jgi:dTDP-4-dehydrorhamnose reductase